jgi:transposase InsO family protein
VGRERYVVDAVVLEGRSAREVARASGVSKSWVSKLVSRFREGGYPALEPRSKRPRSCPQQVSSEVVDAIVKLRHDLGEAGHDCGAHTIAYHLGQSSKDVPSVSTIWRILHRQGLITPQPHKRPRSSYIRFQAELPNEMWQGDVTHWLLADGSHAEILNFIDDHSRLSPASTAFLVVKSLDVVQTFYDASQTYGFPASLLTDNGAVFTAKYRHGKVLLESELETLGIQFKHSTPYHPQTCGKVERFHQTLKRYLAKQPPAQSLAHLQLQLDSFRTYYNQQRPHRALDQRTPLQAFHARIKARPAAPAPETHFRVRTDRVDASGTVTIRYLTRLYHIGVDRAFKRQPIYLLIAGRHIRIIHEDGYLIRELILDPTRNYQPLGTPKVGLDVVRQVATMS